MSKNRNAAATAASVNSPALNDFRKNFAGRTKIEFASEGRPVYTSADHGMTDAEYQRYVATCEQSYDIMQQTFALYTLHPNALYVI